MQRKLALLATTAMGLALPLVAAPPAGAVPVTFSYTGPPVAIEDGGNLAGTDPGTPATATVNVNGVGDVITDVDFRIDGSSCTSTAGATTVGLTHDFAEDLEVTLTSPDGTTIELLRFVGGTGNNFCQVVLDDDAGAPPIQGAISASAPFTGTWTPSEALAAFDGEDPNGDWTVSVTDWFSINTGILRAFSVIVDTTSTDVTPPVVSGVAVAPAIPVTGLPITVSATATDATSDIGSASVSVDGGPAIPMTAADGAFDEPAEDVVADLGFLLPGSRTVCVTAADQWGNTSAPACTTFFVYAPTDPPEPGPGPNPDPGPDPTDAGPEPTPGSVARVAGTDRVGTAVAISQQLHPAPGSAAVVVLARLDGFADALAGGPYAAAHGGPLLLTAGDQLDAATEAEILRVLPPDGPVVVLGGTDAIGAGVVARLTALGFTVERIGGADRYATAVAVAETATNPSAVLLASGLDFPDAVSAGAAAAATGAVVVLTAGAEHAAATAAYLAARPALPRFAVGGPAAAAEPAATALVGADRFATAVAVAQQFFPSPTSVAVASGRAFPDALTGGVHAGIDDAPLLLTEPDALPPATGEYLAANRGTIDAAFVYGGEGAVTAGVVDAILGAIV